MDGSVRHFGEIVEQFFVASGTKLGRREEKEIVYVTRTCDAEVLQILIGASIECFNFAKSVLS